VEGLVEEQSGLPRSRGLVEEQSRLLVKGGGLIVEEHSGMTD